MGDFFSTQDLLVLCKAFVHTVRMPRRALGFEYPPPPVLKNEACVVVSTDSPPAPPPFPIHPGHAKLRLLCSGKAAPSLQGVQGSLARTLAKNTVGRLLANPQREKEDLIRRGIILPGALPPPPDRLCFNTGTAPGGGGRVLTPCRDGPCWVENLCRQQTALDCFRDSTASMRAAGGALFCGEGVALGSGHYGVLD